MILYTIKMLAAFIVGMFLVVESARLAAEGKWVSVCVLGALVFIVFFYMAAASVRAERGVSK